MPEGRGILVESPPYRRLKYTVDPVGLIDKYYAPYPVARDVLLRHSEMVARKALEVARGAPHLDPDMEFIREAAMLHDIGIFLTHAPVLGCSGESPYICHGCLGREILEQEGLPRHALVSERHVGVGITARDVKAGGLPLPARDMSPVSVEEKIICFADKFFSKDTAPPGEKPMGQVRAAIERYGPEKLAVFDGWVGLFSAGGL
jgi:uncharacterized protein